MSYLCKCILLNSQAGFFIEDFNMLLVAALAIGIVIVVGFMMVSKRKKREPVPAYYRIIHITATIIGALIAVIAAFMGDTRIWINVVLAIIIVILGLFLGFGKLKKSTAKTILFGHAAIGIICYSIFLYYIIAIL